MIRKTLAIVAGWAAALATPVIAMPPADSWEIGPWVRGRNYSVGMPATPSAAPGGGVSFVFPLQGRGQIDAMTTATAPIAGARRITLRYRVEVARGTRFIAHETPGEAATVSLYLQRSGDNWSGKGRFQSYRWYTPVHAVMPLSPGEHTITVSLDEVWTNVYSQPNSNAEQREPFAATLQNTATIGLAFGSVSRRSHGVYATGPARFTLLDLDIR
ncbi:hypothetical protein ACWPM1_10015 [Tsuneonella sp. HG249]